MLESTKSQTPSTKPGPRPEGGDSEGEITNKSQIPILNDQNRFGISNNAYAPNSAKNFFSPRGAVSQFATFTGFRISSA